MSFTEKNIDLTLILGADAFSGTNSNTVKLSGLRVSSEIVVGGAPYMASATIRAYGLTLSMLNQFYNVGIFTNQLQTQKLNTIILEAGDDVYGKRLVFTGVVRYAYIRNLSPDSMIEISAMPTVYLNVMTSTPSSYPTGVSAAVAMANLAAKGGRKFINVNVSVTLPKSFFNGSVGEQMRQVATNANINYYDDGQTVWIWNKGTNRIENPIQVSAKTGMIGYPTGWQLGVEINHEFNPDIQLGSKVQVTSQLKFANGIFTAYNVTHTLESQMPSGKWFTHFYGVPQV